MAKVSTVVLKLLVAAFNLCFTVANFVLSCSFGYYVTRIAHHSRTVLAIQFTLVGLTITFGFGLYITLQKKFVLLKLYAVVLAALTAAQALAVASLVSMGATGVFTDVVTQFCTEAKGAMSQLGSSSLEEEAAWVCCCPSTCDPTSDLWMNAVVADWLTAFRAQPPTPAFTPSNNPKDYRAWSPSLVPRGQFQGQECAVPGSFVEAFFNPYPSRPGQPPPPPKARNALEEYKLWKWPLLACPVKDPSLVQKYGQDKDGNPVGAAAEVRALGRLASWMAGYKGYEFQVIPTPDSSSIGFENVGVAWCDSEWSVQDKDQDQDHEDLTSNAPCGRHLYSHGAGCKGSACPRACNKMACVGQNLSNFQLPGCGGRYLQGVVECNPAADPLKPGQAPLPDLVHPGCGKVVDEKAGKSERPCDESSGDKHGPQCFSNWAADSGQTCKTMDSCLVAFAHGQQTSFDRFVAALALFLVLEALVIVGTWHLSKRTSTPEGAADDTAGAGGGGALGESLLDDGVSTRDAV